KSAVVAGLLACASLGANASSIVWEVNQPKTEIYYSDGVKPVVLLYKGLYVDFKTCSIVIGKGRDSKTIENFWFGVYNNVKTSCDPYKIEWEAVREAGGKVIVTAYREEATSKDVKLEAEMVDDENVFTVYAKMSNNFRLVEFFKRR
ncbi:MAG: hypothetical protein ACRDCE_15490, partial [Cetobacterium sp.]|uniref:hypothetical protein n=1 Tax=Cetobacterium sp. TaxID=2071632 RepID=UPI003EE584B2